MRHTALMLLTLAAAAALVAGGCGDGANKGADIRMPPTREQKIQEIQNNPHMSPQAKAQAMAAFGGSTPVASAPKK